MKKTKKYELIVAIVNQKFTDAVIQATRKAGASGGTIISARGKGKEEAQKNYGLALTADKDLIMILVEVKTKEKIMDAIYKAAGIETKGMAIIFTLPANHVIGLRKPKANKK